MVQYNELNRCMQNLGEVKVKVSMHTTEVQESGDVLFRPDQAVCFALDALKETSKKAKKAGNYYHSQFFLQTMFPHTVQ